MSREIKFRAWDKEYEQYHEETHRLMIRLDGKVYNSEYGDLQCDRFIIEQFTGLTDIKDIEIYEGDILKVTRTNPVWEHDIVENLPVAYGGCKFFVQTSHQALTVSNNYLGIKVEVISNIHQNPELLSCK